MKNFKKFTAFVLALCMLFSLSVAAFAADADERTIYDSAPDEISRGRLCGIRSRRSGLMIWTHCISLTLRTGLKTVSI